jgi:hypothetical protein
MTYKVIAQRMEPFQFTDGSQLIPTSAKWFIGQTVWEANRTLDPDHALELERTIENPRTLQGPFTMVAYPAEDGSVQLRVLDGQHRQEVIRRYFAAYTEADDFQILVRRYQIVGHDDAVAIFKQINHAKPILYRGSDTERLHDIVTALRRHFLHVRPSAHSNVLALIRPSCNRPALSVEHLEAALQLYEVHRRTDLTPADVVAYADSVNAWLKADPVKRIQARVTHTCLDRAKEYEFFLGLDTRCAWLAGLRSALPS